MTSTTRPHALSRPQIRPLASLSTALVALFDGMMVWQERSRPRRQLSEMDDYLLRDMGMSRADLQRELEKPFWRA